MLKKVITFLVLIPAVTLAYVSPGAPSGFVNDYAGVLNKNERLGLETKLSEIGRETGNEISVVLVKDLDGDTVENYAVTLFKEWKIGKKDKDNGVLLLFAMDDRKMRIEVGYGFEGALTDIEAHSIILNTLSPAFKQGDYYGGINRAVDDITRAIKSEYIPENVLNSSQSYGTDWFINFLALCFFALVSLVSILARSKSWWAGGVLGGIIGLITTLVAGFFYLGMTALIVLIPLGLIMDFLVSRAYARGKITGHYPWWIGGSPGGGFSSGGGFGGFGGGGSGGGGSSGDW